MTRMTAISRYIIGVLTAARIAFQVIGAILGVGVAIFHIGAVIELFEGWIGWFGRPVGFVAAFPLFPLIFILPWFDAWVSESDVKPVVFWCWALMWVSWGTTLAIAGLISLLRSVGRNDSNMVREGE
jgi:hypothetical protein